LQGAICVDTLGSGWSPVQTIKSALISLRMLLEFPNPRDPQDAEVAKMMLNDPAMFAAKANEWAVRFAGAPAREVDMNNYIGNYKSAAPVAAPAHDSSRYATRPGTWLAYGNMGCEGPRWIDVRS
jgi:ubiquitin-conjugating enzyme (huntingtin interacting protein 2)